MSAYVVVEIGVEDPVTFERYKTLAPPSVAAYGGRYLVRGGAWEALEGSWHPPRFVILEFPSVQRAKSWWSSPAYAPAKELLRSCARTEMLLVDGVPPNFAP